MPSVWTIPLFIAFALTSLVAIEAFLTPGDRAAPGANTLGLKPAVVKFESRRLAYFLFRQCLTFPSQRTDTNAGLT